MSDTSARAVIVGAGHAGGSVAALLRQYGWQGPVTLIGAEPVPPYQRPPLSKAWLKGEGDLAGLLLRPAAFYQANRIDLRLACEVTAIDRAARAVTVATGDRVAYDHLILATGCYARPLPVPGHDLAGIVTLRTLADADRLRTLPRPGARIAIIGAGYIGLEVAASARILGADVVVIEREPRVLARVASIPLSDFFQRRHAAEGVRIMLNAAVEAFEGAARPRRRGAPVGRHRHSVRRRADRRRRGTERCAGARGRARLRQRHRRRSRRPHRGSRHPRDRRLHPAAAAAVSPDRSPRERAECPGAGEAGRRRSVRPPGSRSRGAVVLVRSVPRSGCRSPAFPSM